MSTTAASLETPSTPALQSPARARNPFSSFLALLKRELLQHRGTLVYTPLVIMAIVVVVSAMGIITGENMRFGLGRDTPPLNQLVTMIGGDGMHPQRVLFFKGVFFGTYTIFHCLLFFTMLLYCLGALYEERKDRSILFWKSLPVSDTRTVLSKLVTVTLVAPAIMLLVVLLTWFFLLLLFSITVWRHDGNAWTMVWGSSSTFTMLSRAGFLELINALWMLPVFSWVLLCSSWSRVRPFLWAVMVPFWIVLLGWWIGTTSFARIGLDTLARWILERLASGIMPLGPGHNLGRIHGIAAVEMSPTPIAQSLTWPSMWIGVAIGVGFLALAIYLRRYRDDSL